MQAIRFPAQTRRSRPVRARQTNEPPPPPPHLHCGRNLIDPTRVFRLPPPPDRPGRRRRLPALASLIIGRSAEQRRPSRRPNERASSAEFAQLWRGQTLADALRNFYRQFSASRRCAKLAECCWRRARHFPTTIAAAAAATAA